jgi:hypothetical protein
MLRTKTTRIISDFLRRQVGDILSLFACDEE